MTLFTSRAVDPLKPKDKPYKMAIDRGLQLRVAPDGVKTLLVRYTVQGTSAVRQYCLPQTLAEALREYVEEKRRAGYAMQVLRVVLRWQGIKIEDNPLSQETAGRNRIVLAPPRGDPKPIPAEKLGAWWLAACASPRRVAANYYGFQLLTGCRGVEILGEKKYDYEPIRVRDVNLETGRILLIDTKNRSNHLLLLSREALAIAKEACEGREPEEPLFPITDARKTLAWINKQAGTTVQGHDMRATFTTIAEELVSGGVLKRMINHVTNGDVTLGHYVGKGEAQLRAGWQTVADFIGNAAAEETARRATPDAMPAADAGELVVAVVSETAVEMA